MIWVWLAMAMAHPDGHERIAALELAPADGSCAAEALLERGRLHLELGELDDALSDVDRARACDTALEGLDQLQGRVHFARGEFPSARTALERHLGQRPDDRAARLLLARTLLQLDQPALADQAFSQALGPETRPVPDHDLWWSTARERAGNVQGALEVVQASLSRNPGVPALEERAVSLEVALGRHDQAVARLDAWIARSPTVLSLRARKAGVLEQAGAN